MSGAEDPRKRRAIGNLHDGIAVALFCLAVAVMIQSVRTALQWLVGGGADD